MEFMKKFCLFLTGLIIGFFVCLFAIASDAKNWAVAITHLWDTAHVMVDWEVKQMWVVEFYKNEYEEKFWLVELKTWVVENMVWDYSCPDVIWHWECSIEMSKDDLLYFLDK